MSAVLPQRGQTWESKLHPGALVRIRSCDGFDVQYLMFDAPEHLADNIGYEGGADVGEFTEFFSVVQPTPPQRVTTIVSPVHDSC